MSLSDSHKEAVKSWVTKIRQLLDQDFQVQLERLGLRRTGSHVALDQMRLPTEALAERHSLKALLDRETKAEGTPERGYENLLRELTYTLINRLVGLKAMEARRLLYLTPPASPGEPAEETEVVTPLPGQARSRYLRDFRAAHGSQYKYAEDAEERLLRDGLTAAFRQVTEDIRVLFDPDHEYACIWPSHPVLSGALALINDGLPIEAYRAHDFLGWVYQFFNREEKKRVRDENKGIPRSSYELAVINQFYTPSWVVKTLVDNTLGRLWIQMHPDSSLYSTTPPPLPDERTSDVPVADYLVPRTGEKIRYQKLMDDGTVKRFKLAREITLIDPACGTMHFGQYAFGLFFQMYLDELKHAGEPGWPSEPSVGGVKDIPAAILENILFGIDIDPRAIQIASLSLMLTAKEAALKHGFSPTDVKVRRSNLVVANAVNLGEAKLKKVVGEVMKRHTAKDSRKEGLGEAVFSSVWDNIQLVSELGSLVQVREGVSQALNAWIEARSRESGLTNLMPRRSGPQLELGSFRADHEEAKSKQLLLKVKAHRAEAEILEQELLQAIEAAAGQTTEDAAERLFAGDTARGLKLLRMLRRRYDVAVMNPPYGSFVPSVKEYVKAAYPLTYNDIYAAFIDRGTQLTEKGGYVGALVSSTFKNLTSFEKLRTELLLKRNPLIVLLDLGFGILDDATVEAAALVLHGGV